MVTLSDVNVGLFDSDTDESLEAEKVVDVTDSQNRAEKALLVYTTAKRGRIVQLQSGKSVCIHYFLDEPRGRNMMIEDSERFGFAPGQLLALADAHNY